MKMCMNFLLNKKFGKITKNCCFELYYVTSFLNKYVFIEIFNNMPFHLNKRNRIATAESVIFTFTPNLTF